MTRLDLDALRPANHSFTHRGVDYEIPAEIAVETIVEALQLREKFQASEDSGDEGEMVAAMEAMRGIIWTLIDEATPEPVARGGTLTDGDRELLLQVSAFPDGTRVELPDGRVVVRDPEGPALRARRSYPRLSIEEITAVLALAMEGNREAGDTPESLARRAVQDEGGEGGNGAEEPPEGDPTDSSATSETAPAVAVSTDPEPAPI